ncbi:hypothetical protein [Cryobacterium tagatosivorans]|uniref:Uncharacterized protein n=1 Tax=Cryobacterium tagatosivorans TaxID=1259199 RepID=A0A4R8UCV1_9MICO|nr:hypothetical protein [Cryobacterium tagatosivorans]TFB47001.1 hypothetical protein E3O23_16165 [Cryobacterium tagatosivorans]
MTAPVRGAGRGRPRAGTWVLGGASLYLALAGLVTGGLPGLLLVVGVIGLATASHALLTGRRTWALIPSRTVAAGCLAACLVLTSFGAALSNPVNEPDLAAGSASNATARIAGSAADTDGDVAGDSAADSAADSAGATEAPAAPPAEITMAQARVTPPIIAERKVIGTSTDTFAMTLLEALPVKNTCRMALPSTCRIPD